VNFSQRDDKTVVDQIKIPPHAATTAIGSEARKVRAFGEIRLFANRTKHALAKRPQRNPKNGDNHDSANARRPGCRKCWARWTICDARMPATQNTATSGTNDKVPVFFKKARRICRLRRTTKYIGIAMRYARRIPSNVTPAVPIHAPNRDQRNGCAGSPMSFPMNNGDEDTPKKRIKGTTDATGASQNARLSFAMKRRFMVHIVLQSNRLDGCGYGRASHRLTGQNSRMGSFPSCRQSAHEDLRWVLNDLRNDDGAVVTVYGLNLGVPDEFCNAICHWILVQGSGTLGSRWSTVLTIRPLYL